MRRVLVTGSRLWVWQTPVWNALAVSGPDVIIHGGARGADRYAGTYADHYGVPVEVYEANWELHGKAAGVIRNQEMLDSGVTVCLAFPHAAGRGTQDMMRRSHARGVKVWVFDPESGVMVPHVG